MASMTKAANISDASLMALKRLRRKQSSTEWCELCARALEGRHAHLLDPQARRILCACDPCAFLFQDGAGRYRRVPRDSFFLSDLALDNLQWESLSIPVNLAFFFFSSPAKRVVAYYPSPGGATESLLTLEAWEGIAAAHSRIGQMQPDVEALLVNRVASPPDYYIVPIDRCYELSGIVRKHWQGFTGGDDVWREVANFFAALRSEAVTVEEQLA
jgi:hypothetical protein